MDYVKIKIKKELAYLILRKSFPYCVDMNEKGEYYLLNRDYEYIGLNGVKVVPKSHGKSTRTYLFNDGTDPLYSEKLFEIYLDNFEKIIEGKCMMVPEYCLFVFKQQISTYLHRTLKC